MDQSPETRQDDVIDELVTGPVVITVATYRRPQLLGDLLRSLSDMQTTVSFRVVVVDNDAEASAESVARASALNVTYVVEPCAGIAQARNRGLDEVRDDDRAIIFVDDDERVHSGWLDALVSGWTTHQSDVVTGPVISVFATDCPRWIREGGFIQRPRHATGASLDTAATNNTLLSVPAWADAGRPVFDESFSETGGSDTAFFTKLVSQGSRITWIDEALVEEDVPADRATFGWIWQRAVRGGNVQARVRAAGRSKISLLPRVVLALPYRGVRLLIGLIVHRRLRAVDLVPLAWQWGLLGALTGRLVREYRRA
jgi:succinoglycan biosynthesis protein ExoM